MALIEQTYPIPGSDASVYFRIETVHPIPSQTYPAIADLAAAAEAVALHLEADAQARQQSSLAERFPALKPHWDEDDPQPDDDPTVQLQNLEIVPMDPPKAGRLVASVATGPQTLVVPFRPEDHDGFGENPK
jgi:hypothetical protein